MVQQIEAQPVTLQEAHVVAALTINATPGEGEAWAALAERFGEAAATAVARPEFGGGRGATASFDVGDAAKRGLVIGLGFDALDKQPADASPGGRGEALRVAAAAALRATKAAKATSLLIVLDERVFEHVASDDAATALGEGLSLASMKFDHFHGTANAPDAQDTDDTTHADAEQSEASDIQVDLLPANDSLAPGLLLGEAANHARTLAAQPANFASTDAIAEHCQQLGKQFGLNVEVLEANQLQQLSMGGILAVGRAGSTPPKLVILEHAPDDHKDDKPVALVGKGVVFDTGGYSLKSTGGLGMKYDKCGGMAVIATLAWAAQAKLPRRVVGLVPLAENMVDAQGFRPDDILTMHNGVTVEVTNTDAEGRLLLADALSYATSTYDCHAVIDVATLTGGVVVALGPDGAGLWCNDDALRDALMSASESSGERLWQLPLWQEHRQLMSGSHADLVNSSAKRHAHPIQGAAFLSYFVGPEAPKQIPTSVPWAHLDIAGTASTDGSLPLYDKGPTGSTVRLLARYLQS